MAKRRVGIVGFGALGEFLYTQLTTDPQAQAAFELVFVWNRTASKLTAAGVAPELVLEDLRAFEARGAELIVEVAHPGLYAEYGAAFATAADVFVGSPTVFADREAGDALVRAAAAQRHTLYVPSGALWGAQDISKMKDRGSVTGLHITMKKPGTSFRLEEPLRSKLDAFMADPAAPAECVLYDGPVRELCPLAPNNVNTMACAALASVGFDDARGTLIAERGTAAHVIELQVVGKAPPGRTDKFEVTTVRRNPCDPHSVTASATYPSFYSSLLNTLPPRAPGKVEFC